MDDRAGSTQDQIVTFLRKRDYRLLGELGHGACGRTVLLHDDQIDEQFVCKKYCPSAESQRTELFGNFVREIKLLHQVHHPNVVRVFNYYLYPDQFMGFILMEFVDGTDIEEFIAANPEKTNDIFVQVISGFAYLESVGILHRDIRPRNLMVTSDGVAKIIDLGFGKRVVTSKDFDKSISLNWWCEPPKDFDDSRYDFATEVYFVGKLFEKMIQENGISHFHYTSALRSMCNRDHDSRVQAFATVLQQLRNDQFSEMSFSYLERNTYRRFADALCGRISKIKNGTEYIHDLERIERQLRDVYRKVMLEESIPDCAVVSRCFLEGMYYYQKNGFSVDVLRQFIGLLQSCASERGRILLANLHTRLDTIPRYSEQPNDDIPF